ncbi:MAG TPA: flavohemoglobin expression-modulating QEGLA motif protein [Bacteroidaceae bacterium]|nr:flavohemoglobin expression-modulating QEGLA motif protein [Bacteroidaceae bacterium]
MLKLDINTIIKKIRTEEQFEAYLDDGSLYIRIAEYVPYVCLAVHNGHRIRPDLEQLCLLNDFERWYEEDPNTLDFIYSFPIVIAGMDSRYEYDLNRSPEEAIYDVAWGKQVWKKPLSEEQKALSLKKHAVFYQLLQVLFEKLTADYHSVLAFDVHSYNYRRLDKKCPLFNLGTGGLGTDRYEKNIAFFSKELGKISLPNIDVSVAENVVFSGNGYLLKTIRKNFPDALVLATEIKKVYCNEDTGEIYPIIIEKLSHQLKSAIVNTTADFTLTDLQLKKRKKPGLLSSDIDSALIDVDRQLFKIARDFEILNYVNPVNIDQAKKEFFRSKYIKDPQFRYSQLSINPFEFKRDLYALRVEQIHDISLRLLYQDVIDAYADKIDIIASIGTGKFLYNSMRYFGEPDQTDILNANYILHCSTSADGREEFNLTAEDVKNYFIDVMNGYGFECRIEITGKIIAKVLILNSKKIIRIRKDAMFSEKSLRALSEHEVGVHMLTTINSRLQTLNIFRLGLPRNTRTQEGLAILSEYISGNMSINRLQMLALRVITIDLMLKGNSFCRTFRHIMDTGLMNEEQAFYLVSRIYRGGGFTKDYLYLRGFRDVLRMYNTNNGQFKNLLIGKTSIEYLDLINEMIGRHIFNPPKYRTKSFITPRTPQPIIRYVIDGLK